MTDTATTPIIMPVYNRPDLLSQVLAAVRGQTILPPVLLFFADAARAPDDQPGVDAVRRLIHAIDWIDVRIVERGRNWGCPANTVDAFDQAFREYPRAVLVEDDIVPASHYYEAMNTLLDHYAPETRVFSVGAYPQLMPGALPGYPYDTIVSPRFKSWGCGIWADRWQSLSPDIHDFHNPFGLPEDVPTHAGQDMIREARNIERKGPGYSWAMPLALLCLHRELLAVHTRWYLVNHIGFESGVHFRPNSAMTAFYHDTNPLTDRLPMNMAPPIPREDVRTEIMAYLDTARAKALNSTPLLQRLFKRIVKSTKRRLRHSRRKRD